MTRPHRGETTRTPGPTAHKALGVFLGALVLLALLGTLVPHRQPAQSATTVTRHALGGTNSRVRSPTGESAESVAKRVGTDVAIGVPPPRADVAPALWSHLEGSKATGSLRPTDPSATVTEMGRDGPDALYLVTVTAIGTPAVDVDVVVRDTGPHPVVEAIPGIAG